jgi:hypothetical protein
MLVIMMVFMNGDVKYLKRVVSKAYGNTHDWDEELIGDETKS